MTNKNSKERINHSNLVSFLSYLGIGIIWYFIDNKVQNKFTKFHVKQAINLIIISFLVRVLVMFVFMFIPFIGWMVIYLVNIAILVLFIFGFYYSLIGEKKEIPIIGHLAENYLKF